MIGSMSFSWRSRAVLEKLARRAEQTHTRVVRRLRTLDDQYGFIRTHIFWLRDQEPIGLSTLTQAHARDVSRGKVGDPAGSRGERPPALGPDLRGVRLVEPLGLLILILPAYSGSASGCSGCRGGPVLRLGVVVWRGVLVSMAYSAILPIYICLLAYTARQAPWPRSVAVPLAHGLAMLAPPAVNSRPGALDAPPPRMGGNDAEGAGRRDPPALFDRLCTDPGGGAAPFAVLAPLPGVAHSGRKGRLVRLARAVPRPRVRADHLGAWSSDWPEAGPR